VLGAYPNGAAWLDSLSALVAGCEERWHIVAQPPFELSYSYVAPATSTTGREVVPKLGVPNAELSSEIKALQAYDGSGAVRLLDFDAERGFLLLERATPGDNLATLNDDERATRIAANLMRALWRPLPNNGAFPTTAQWADGLGRLRKTFDGRTGPFARRLVEMTESFFVELHVSAEPPVLLHGDLHHFNILSAERRPWIAIDPKGLAGERAYEVGALLRNPTPSLYLDVAIQRRRIRVLAEELTLDAQRIVRWATAQAVLSAWWSYEESGSGWESACACAEVLSKLIT
jgi:streptomycin 6-kinase